MLRKLRIRTVVKLKQLFYVRVCVCKVAQLGTKWRFV